MSSEKEFKDILNDKLAEKEFHFNEENWKETRAFIDASREDKRKRFAGYFIIAALLLVTGTIGVYLFNSNSPAKSQGSVALNTKAENTNQAEEATITTENNAVKKPAQHESVEKNTVKNQANENNAEETATIENKSVSQAPSAEEKQTVVKTDRVKISSKPNNEKLTAAAILPGKSTTKHPNTIKNNPLAETQKNNGNVQNNPSDGNQPVKENNSSNPDLAGTSAPEQNQDPEQNKETVSANDTTANTAPGATAAVAMATSTAAAPLKTDSAANEIQAGMPKDKKNYRNFFAVEAGANYFMGWKNPGQKDANGFSPVAGVSYTSLFGKNLMFSTGIYYSSVRNLSYGNKTSSITRYKLGAESDITVVTPTTLRYVDIPVKLAFTLNQNHAFGAGYHFGYLVTSVSTVEKYSARQFSRSESYITKTTGYTEGLRSTDHQLSVFYRRRLAKDVYINLELMMGLTDVKNNSFFGSDVTERNNGLRLTLIYNLLKH